MVALVIGGGFAGMASAAYLQHSGLDVTLVERHSIIGREGANHGKAAGYTFDMGPSWYLMPEVFENFFAAFRKESGRLLQHQETGSLPIGSFFRGEDPVDIGADLESTLELFESLEKGGRQKLKELSRRLRL